MSDETLAPFVAIALLGALALWVPFSSFCNARCQDVLLGRRNRRRVAAPVEEETKVDKAA